MIDRGNHSIQFIHVKFSGLKGGYPLTPIKRKLLCTQQKLSTDKGNLLSIDEYFYQSTISEYE